MHASEGDRPQALGLDAIAKRFDEQLEELSDMTAQFQQETAHRLQQELADAIDGQQHDMAMMEENIVRRVVAAMDARLDPLVEAVRRLEAKYAPENEEI